MDINEAQEYTVINYYDVAMFEALNDLFEDKYGLKLKLETI